MNLPWLLHTRRKGSQRQNYEDSKKDWKKYKKKGNWGRVLAVESRNCDAGNGFCSPRHLNSDE